MHPEPTVEQQKQRINEVWSQFLAYARQVEAKTDWYWGKIGNTQDPQTVEQLKGIADWVKRTKGSYESKLWEMDVLVNHLGSDPNAVGYLGYDVHTHPDVSIVNRAARTAVAIEMKQVESQEAPQVHPNIYAALTQLWAREYFDPNTPYTRWKMYIYINPGNPWPWTKAADAGKTYETLIAEKATEQKKTVSWANWKALGGEHKVEVSIWHADFGRIDYTLQQ